MRRRLTVVGHGAATVVPNTAVVRVAAVERAATVGTAYDAVARSGAALAAAAAAVIGTTVGSEGLRVHPAHDDRGRRDGFECRQEYRISCGSVDAAAEVIDVLVAEVGDRLEVDSVTFEVADRGPALAAARERAWGDARAKAEHLAGLAAAALGEVVGVVEGVGARPYAPAREMASIGFEPGEQEVAASLTVTYALG